MVEKKPYNLGEQFAYKRAIRNLIQANSVSNLIAQIELPLSPDRGNDLLSTGQLTLAEYHALTKNPDYQDSLLRNAALKLRYLRTAHLGLLKEFGATLLHQNRPEAIPILVATDTFLDDDIQNSIEDQNLMRGDAMDVMLKAFDVMEHGGAIIFPTLSEEHDSIAVIHNPDRQPFFRRYKGHVLDRRVLERTSPVTLALEMIRPRKHPKFEA